MAYDKKITSLLLVLCMVLPIMPRIPTVKAADASPQADGDYNYVLDTDGIDPGEQYLIVSGTVTNSYALKMDSSKYWETSSSAVTVLNGDTINPFSGDNLCLWTFSSSSNGTVYSNGYYLNIEQYSRYQTNGATMQFAHLGSGAYGIYMFGGANSNLQYLNFGYSNTTSTTKTWNTLYKYGAYGNVASSYTEGFVYLFKRVQADNGYSVTYYGNGNTAGKTPANAEALEAGSSYTILAPTADFCKENGNDTYLFWGWNTKYDGTGTDYEAGQTITMTEDIVLYAKWYLQTKYEIEVTTDLDEIATDYDVILGKDVVLYALADVEGSELIELTKTADGVYTAYVTEIGNYDIYASLNGGEPKKLYDYKIVIYNQGGSAEVLNYSVSYDANGGQWQDGSAPLTVNYHIGDTVYASENIPVREGYVFRGWEDQNGNVIEAGGIITSSISEKTVLTAQWEDLVNVTVNIRIDHTSITGVNDDYDGKSNVSFFLLHEHNGVNHPIGSEYVLDSSHGSYVFEDGATKYTVNIGGQPVGLYTVSTAKSGYENEITRTILENGDQIIDVVYTYSPDNFDLNFKVDVDLGDLPANLLPEAVNVKVIYWGHNYNNELGWHVIANQEGNAAPYTVFIDENGKGSGFYPVSQHRPANDNAYEYRVVVTSFVMPDGSVVPARNTDSYVTFVPDGSGLYRAMVEIEGEGRNPQYPDGSDTPHNGAYYDGEKQVGTPIVKISVTPFTVTFNAGNGLIDGQQTLVLENQYVYPQLNGYISEPNNSEERFFGWMIDGEAAENKFGSYLTGDVVYTAHYSAHLVISGTVKVDGTYEQEGETVIIKDPDRVDEVIAVLQKGTNGIYNDVDSQFISVNYNETEGTADYTFYVPGDGLEYRVVIFTQNYRSLYDNNGDGEYTENESSVTLDKEVGGSVDVHLTFAPDSFNQWCFVDSSLIDKSFRPDNALIQILYRSLGDIRPYAVISQHTVEPYGIDVALDGSGKGYGFCDIWNWHNDGSLYEYQLDLYKIYGNSDIYGNNGTEYTSDSPFYIEHGLPSYWVDVTQGKSINTLKLKLVPKQYDIVFDLNLESGADSQVFGMESYRVDNGSSDEYYAYSHTWSFSDNINAYPYREGYVFEGWESDHDGIVIKDGNISIGAAVAETVTLKAKWTKLSGTDYTVRHLEINTDKVLQGAQTITGSVKGEVVKAAVRAAGIEGYEYAGAMIGGTYYSKESDPALTVSDDPLSNLLVIYYMPDGSDGYTEQVESNLTLNKTAVLEDNGTYTVQIETFTKDNPITTFIQQNTPLDIVLVLDQSGSIINSGYLDDLQAAVNNFIKLIADHGREYEVDHRIAMVGYAGDYDEPPTSTNTSTHPIAGGNTTNWVNTGVFDSNGDFHPYPVTGFNYTKYNGTPKTDGIYYAYSEGEYLLLTYHKEYRHLITEEEARFAVLDGQTVYGYVNGEFTPLTRNTSGLWLYGDRQLYSLTEFFTYHEDVWTHRKGLEHRQIHAYGVGSDYTCTDGHGDLYTRSETTAAGPELDVYKDALVPVSVGALGSGGINPGLTKSTSHLGSNGGTFVQYGIEMANRVFASNPLDPTEGRVRIMVMFTDGLPGIGTFDENVANEAIGQAYITKNTHDAYAYTIGLYHSGGVNETSDEAFYMNAVSSNYPNAKTMDDVMTGNQYVKLEDGKVLRSGEGSYYVYAGGSYRALSYSNNNGWRYTYYYTRTLTREANPVVTNGKIGGYDIYEYTSLGYAPTENSGYYSTTDSEDDLKDYFSHIVQEITTKITTEIILHEDTIIRDIMGQGLVLTPGTVITAYRQKGVIDTTSGEIVWSGVNERLASVEITENSADTVYSEETTEMSYTLEDGTSVTKENVPYISVYNLKSKNATDPDGENYHPHTIDVTGYDFDKWYIKAGEKPEGYKMVVTITRIEARDDVEWGRSVLTNNEQSGLWLPEDSDGNRELLLPFKQPTTIFVERAYVLDYGKEFVLSGWYFDSEGENDAHAIHVDCNVENGMNWFDEESPTVSNGVDSKYGNTKYGNVTVKDGKVSYTPVTTCWGGYDQFYVFGNTWRKTVNAQSANTNGNLWNKVTVIPANNVYYEDSFVTAEGGEVNGINGFVFSGAWETVYSDGGESGAGQNVEKPEHVETAPNGDVHGWTDSLDDDLQYTDGSAHGTGSNGEMGATAEFTFTGTGVDVYTRTNDKSGMVVAVLYRITETEGENGETVVTETQVGGQFVDNLAVSGDYYHIPSVSFCNLLYGTYKVTLIATSASITLEDERFEYYVDGIRVYNPLSGIQNTAAPVVKTAYEKELNAVFTEIRDILLDYDDFNVDTEDGTDGKFGAVFIDMIQDGQQGETDSVGQGLPTYEVGTFEKYGPKNEVYLSEGQAIVLKVDLSNTYYVGLKSLNGGEVVAKVSGIDREEAALIALSHTTDMYYRVTPVDGYIVIQNVSDNGSVLSLTKLRTTNLEAPAENGGIMTVSDGEAEVYMRTFAARAADIETTVPIIPDEPKDDIESEEKTLAEIHAEALKVLADMLFGSVRGWLVRK